MTAEGKGKYCGECGRHHQPESKGVKLRWMQRFRGFTNSSGCTNRGVSDLVGFVLTVGIILVGVGIVATVGVDQIERYQGTQNVENAERAITVLAGNLEELQESRATVLTSQLAVHNGRLAIDAGNGPTGPSNITVDVNGTDVRLEKEPLRTISYRTEDTQVVYEGGAVILDNPTGDSITLREPSFICSGERATVSFVSIHASDVGQGYSGATASITTQVNETRLHFPVNRSGPDSLGDSVGVNVTISSSHEAAWRDTLEGRGWQNESTISDPVKYECDASSVFVRQTVVGVNVDR